MYSLASQVAAMGSDSIDRSGPRYELQATDQSSLTPLPAIARLPARIDHGIAPKKPIARRIAETVMPPRTRSMNPAARTMTGTIHDQRDKLLSLMATTNRKG